MKVGELARLLDGIGQGLNDLAKKAAEELISFGSAMRPFSDLTVEQFAGFLAQCEEYRRTGAVSTGRRTSQPKAPKAKPAPLTVAEASGRVRQLLTDINLGTVTSTRIDSLMTEIEKGLKGPECSELLTVLGISGKAKTKGQAVDKVRQVLNSQFEMHVKSQALGGNG